MTELVDKRCIDLDIRLSTLEKKVMALGGIPTRTHIHRPSVIPKGWMYSVTFAEKYKFISCTMVNRIIKANDEFFGEKVLQIGSRIYLDPVDMAIYLETQQNVSSRIFNQYNNWKKVCPEVALLSKKASDRVSKSCEIGGLF